MITIIAEIILETFHLGHLISDILSLSLCRNYYIGSGLSHRIWPVTPFELAVFVGLAYHLECQLTAIFNVVVRYIGFGVRATVKFYRFYIEVSIVYILCYYL